MERRSRWLYLLLVPVLALGLAVGCSQQSGSQPDSSQQSSAAAPTKAAAPAKPEVKATFTTFATPGWDYMWMQGQVMKRAFETKGYKLEIKEAPTSIALAYLGMSQGDYDISVDGWSMHQQWFDQHKGKIETVGNMYGGLLNMGMVIPKYIAEKHGIKTIGDLKGKESAFPRPKIYGYESGTGGMNKTDEAVKAYGLDKWEVVYGSVATEMAEAKVAYGNEEGIVMVGWRPHPFNSRWPGQYLEDPKNVYGEITVKAVVTTKLKNEYPDIYGYLENHFVPTLEIEKMMEVSDGEDDVAMAEADKWYEANKDKVAGWWN